MTLDEIKQALLPCFSKTLFTGPDTLFGSDTLKTVFDGSLPDSKLVIDGVLAQGDDAVTITGTGRGPFAGMSVVASFAPSDDDVSVVGHRDQPWQLELRRGVPVARRFTAWQTGRP
jgi:hypothetical protein